MCSASTSSNGFKTNLFLGKNRKKAYASISTRDQKGDPLRGEPSPCVQVCIRVSFRYKSALVTTNDVPKCTEYNEYYPLNLSPQKKHLPPIYLTGITNCNFSSALQMPSIENCKLYSKIVPVVFF